MTFEKIYSDLIMGKTTPQQAKDDISSKDMLKRMDFYIYYHLHIQNVSKEPLTDVQLQELNSIVNILQILYNSGVDSPVRDSEYDIMQEMLVDMGIPRLTGSIEINSNSKVAHTFTNLRGTLDKVYYLDPDEKRTNKSRKYLDEWIKSTEALYERNTGRKINLNDVKIICQPKFDGCSCIQENVEDNKPLWLTRGDTENNLASDVSHIMNIFDDIYTDKNIGVKYEVMITEENKDKINELYRDHPYHNSRQIVTSVLNSNEADFKSEYLYPVPLRLMTNNDRIEHVHPDLIEKFPTMICTFRDRDKIRSFASRNRYVILDGMKFRTDGVVMTILDDDIKIALGRDRNINNFEIAYKFTEETAVTKVKDVEFYVSDFSYITPVLVVNDIMLKGNTINHISLSNKERFDELDLHYGDEVKVLYDIIPYAIIDDSCKRAPNGRKIKFIEECPICHEKLNFDSVQVKCVNSKCPSRLIGRILNYCTNLRIQNIGFRTLDVLYNIGLLNDGIRSLYKLKKKKHEIEDLEGFGKTKTKKIIREIESKRKLKDYELFGSLGIPGISMKTFKLIFSKIKSSEFIDMIRLKTFTLMSAKLVCIKGIGGRTSELIIEYFTNDSNRKELMGLLKEISLSETFNSKISLGKIVFTGCRPDDDLIRIIESKGYEASDSWNNSAKYLVVPNDMYESSKVIKAKESHVPIISINNIRSIME